MFNNILLQLIITNWPLLLVIIIVVVIVKVYFPISEKDDKSKNIYNYRRKDFLMSRPEHEFFDILGSILGNQYYIFPQVHLSTILDNKVKGQNWRGAFRHVDEKSVDFVICDKAYIKPLLAIELDDSSHTISDRREKDLEKDRIFKEACLPLLRIENQARFNKEEISSRIAAALH